jgi:ubiquinone/menaquinone biosynthesis C-methylase UbiE
MKDKKTHWDNVYSKSELDKLGWYEEIPRPSLELIKKCNLAKSSKLLDVGSGTTTLLEQLANEGYENITALDISKVALESAKRRITPNVKTKFSWIVGDISDSQIIENIPKVDLWHDRTVLHFLTDEKQQLGYLNNLRSLVKVGGYVIIAVFSLEGAKKCSGLDVKNYNQTMIAEFLGTEFDLIKHFPHTYIQPSGSERPYIYTLFQRKH